MVKNSKNATMDFTFLSDLEDDDFECNQNLKSVPPKKKKPVPPLASLPTFKAESRQSRPILDLGASVKKTIQKKTPKPKPVLSPESTSDNDVALTPAQRKIKAQQRVIIYSSRFRCLSKRKLGLMSQSEWRFHIESQLQGLFHMLENSMQASTKSKELFVDSPAGRKEVTRAYLRYLCDRHTDTLSVYCPPFSNTEDLKLFIKEGCTNGNIPYGSRLLKEMDEFETRVLANRDAHDQRKMSIVRSKMGNYATAVEGIAKKFCAKWVIDLPRPQEAYEDWSGKLVEKMGVTSALDLFWSKKGYEPTQEVRRAYCRVVESVATSRGLCMRSDFMSVFKAAKAIYEQPAPNTLQSQTVQDWQL